MSKGIRISKENGLGPHLTFCPRCGKDSDGIILTGAAHQYECPWCHQMHIGAPDHKVCQKCGKAFSKREWVDHGELPVSEKLPLMCKACEEDLKTLNAEVKKGGVPFRCKTCHTEGVIKAETEFAKAWRAEHGKVGIEYEQCPMCGGKKDA
jgi:NMD protein affecting ribosome stability and mRNA decay